MVYISVIITVLFLIIYMFAHERDYLGAQQIMASPEYKKLVNCIQHVKKYSQRTYPQISYETKSGFFKLLYRYDIDEFERLARGESLFLADAQRITVDCIDLMQSVCSPKVCCVREKLYDDTGKEIGEEVTEWIEVEVINCLERVPGRKDEILMALRCQGFKNVVVK